jgi:RimJ/RimL family protein N-acetyltransferase
MSIPSIRIESANRDQAPIILEPADETTLAKLWPVDTSIYAFQPTRDREAFDTPDSYLAQYESGHTWGVKALLGRGAVRLVGVVGLADMDTPAPMAGAFIMDPEQRGHGIGTRATVGIGAYAAEIGLQRVRAQTLLVNEGGKRSLAKAGFVRLRDAVDQDGNVPELPYGDGTEKSSMTIWTMLPPEGYEPDFVLSKSAQDLAREHFATVQAAHSVTLK